MKQTGFTLIEAVIVIFILVVLAVVAIPSFNFFSQSFDVDNGMQEFYTAVALAQSKTVSFEQESRYGVYLDTTTSPHKYIIFKGATYATRDSLADQSFWLPKALEFSSINFGGGSEVVFEKLTGYATQPGNVTVRLKADISKSKTLYISSTGIFGFVAPAAITDTRVKDSRHAHFDYSRVINTATETITLLFDNSTSQVIPIASNMSGGQIEWTGTVVVGGVNQIVTVRTHRLNNADTQFSVHRDRRFNNKSLKITVSGDGSGSLMEYSADGSVTTSTSAYVSNLTLQ